MDPFPWHIAFQSKGGGPEEWIGPDVESVLAELASTKGAEVLVVPIGFVSDHIEILYDIDIAFRQKAESLGMVLKRTRSLNTSERFIEALASAVEENIKERFEESKFELRSVQNAEGGIDSLKSAIQNSEILKYSELIFWREE